MQDRKLDRPTLIKIAAFAGVDPKTAAKYALSDPREEISRRGGALKVREAVHRAAAQLGIRPDGAI